MTVITCQHGPLRGIWFRSDDDLAAFAANPQVTTVPHEATSWDAVGRLLDGMPVRVATPLQWDVLDALCGAPEGAEAP